MHRLHFIRYLFIVVVVLGALWVNIIYVQAAAQPNWEPPQWIPGLVDTGQNPYFVTDPTGKVHVFITQRVDDRIVIMYSNWTVGVGWVLPVDIIASDVGQARITGAFLDDTGMMNIIFWGGDDIHADIFISRAPLNDVMRSTAWSTQLLIGSNAIAPTTSAVVSNQEGAIVVVYSGNDEGTGLYSVTSYDYGVTWTIPDPLYFTMNDYLTPVALQMVISGEETIHAVWALGDDTGNSRRIYQTSRSLRTTGWSLPTVLGEAVEYEADTPSIIEHDGSLIVIFHNDFPTTRFMTYSNDNGESWSSPTRLFDLVGSNGPASLIIDSGNVLHMFFGNRDDISLAHGLWHSTWTGGGWSIPVAVISGPQILMGENDEEGFDPSYIQTVICQGNLLLITWRHDPIASPTHIWFTYQYLNSTAFPEQAVQSPTASITLTQENISLSVTAVAPHEDYGNNFNEIDSKTTNQTLFLSITPALILIIVVLLWRRNRN